MFKIIFDLFNKYRSKYRKHRFDLNNPRVYKCSSFQNEYTSFRGIIYQKFFKQYICQKCGKQIHLDIWKKDIPAEMKYGCIMF